MRSALRLMIVGGAVLSAMAVAYAAGAAAAKKPSLYTNTTHRFSIEPPELDPEGKPRPGVIASFTGFPKDGFAPNINILVQHEKATVDAYLEGTKQGVAKLGPTAKVISADKIKINGKDAIMLDYSANMAKRDLRFLGLAVIDDERVIMITATSLAADFEANEKAFKASLNSFRVLPEGK